MSGVRKVDICCMCSSIVVYLGGYYYGNPVCSSCGVPMVEEANRRAEERRRLSEKELQEALGPPPPRFLSWSYLFGWGR